MLHVYIYMMLNEIVFLFFFNNMMYVFHCSYHMIHIMILMTHILSLDNLEIQKNI